MERAHGKSKKHGKYFSGSYPPTVKIFAVGEKKNTANLLSKNFVPEPRVSRKKFRAFLKKSRAFFKIVPAHFLKKSRLRVFAVGARKTHGKSLEAGPTDGILSPAVSP
jgi:hypothetical protein